MNSTPKPLHYLQALLQADFVVLIKSIRAILASVLAPLYILIISKSVKAQSKLGGAHFLLVLAATMSLMSLAFMGYAVNVARDRERGVFQRLRVTPAPTWTIMASRLLVQAAVGEVIVIIVLIVGGRLDHVTLSAGEYSSTLLLSLLETFLFLSIGQVVVGLIKSATTVNAVGSLLYIVLLFSGLLGLNGVLGSTFQTFAKWTPVGAIMTVFQGTLHQVAWNGHTTLSLLTVFGYIVVCALVGIKWFQWEAR